MSEEDSAIELDLEGFLRRLNSESPRARVVLTSGLLESLLRNAILLRLTKNRSSQELFGPNSRFALAELAKYAHALGMVSDLERQSIQMLSRIRNRISHNWDVSFEDAEIQKNAGNINLIDLVCEGSVSEHQKAFWRTDYLGTSLVEEFANRFSLAGPGIGIEVPHLSLIKIDVSASKKEFVREARS